MRTPLGHMNRPTWLNILGIGACLIVLIAYGCHAVAQNADPSMIKRMTEASNRYNECAYASAISRLKAVDFDINLAAEQGFSSCGSESRLMIGLMTDVGFNRQQIEQVFLEKNTGIKRELRKMVEEIRSKR